MTEPALSADPGSGLPASRRTEVAAAAVCVAFGIIMSALPNLVMWDRYGGPFYVADYDEIVYLQIAGQAHDNHPASLADPVVASGSKSVFSAVSLVPWILTAKAFGTGPLGISLFWRLGAGVGVGLFTFLLLRQGLCRPWVAAALACLLMADCGLLTGHVLVKPWLTAAKVLTGRAGALLATSPRIHTQWRVINPGPSLPYLLLHAWLLLRARERPTVPRLALAGVGFGLLFYIYFYFYTAACVALTLAFLLDAGRRRVYFHTLWVGGLVGLPGVVSSYLFKKSTTPDWLQRSDKFIPIPHFSELMIPWVALALLAVGLMLVALRRRDLTYLGLLALAGVALANNQVLTGLQIENYHWFYVWGPMTSDLAVLLAAGALAGPLSRSRPAVAALLFVLAAHMGVGIWLRWVEATKTRDPAEIAAGYAKYRAEKGSAAARPLAPNDVVAGDPVYQQFAAIVDNQRPLTGPSALISPYVDNASWHERVALNAYLLGTTFEAFEADKRRELETTRWGPWSRDPSTRAAELNKRLAAFRAVEGDAPAALARYRVRHVALSAGRPLPSSVGPGWVKVRAGTSWDLWGRTVDEPKRAPTRRPPATRPS